MKDKKFRNTMIVLGSLAIVIVAGVAIWLTLKPKHKHEEHKEQISVVLPNPETHVSNNDVDTHSKIYEDMTKALEEMLNGQTSSVTIDTVRARLDELAVKIGIDPEALKQLKPSELKDGKIYSSMIGDPIYTRKICKAFDMKVSKTIESTRYEIFADAMVKFHNVEQTKDYQGAVDAIQRAINAIK